MEKRFKIDTIVESGRTHYRIYDYKTGHTITQDFDITDEGFIGERYDENGRWCQK